MRFWIRRGAGTAMLALLAGCGGGDADSGAPTLDDAQRASAAQATAQANATCTAVRPFYWEIGRSGGRLAGGTVGGATPTRETVMPIASASKMLYAGYVAERRAGALSADDIRFLSFRSGYTSFDSCAQLDTVGSCAASGSNGDYTAAHDGKFFYGGGHMQQHAAQPSLMGLAALDNAALAAELRSRLGSAIALDYSQPQPAGGVRMSAADYALFLQRVLAGSLRLRELLGTSAVHTNPLLYPAEALSTPVPLGESWSYSIGHWVETDPLVGDGAFSSAGAFGFYPWIDAGRTSYGVLARVSLATGGSAGGPGMQSAACGRLIRKAWLSGQSIP
ncbi:hypothetical protein [Rivibacter subsaxonicus]|uniref:Beta-lactamase n=1 Tax=Rivibacter subsaxonicus TaxID=457575 RepID=A0A4Q7VVJ3_9BURK|nr:hypothetical protein [Rivibacter subsaxonicus]RZU00603.1 hypothetical protein EV670_1314 [Rivibacter subsaxonicus]